MLTNAKRADHNHEAHEAVQRTKQTHQLQTHRFASMRLCSASNVWKPQMQTNSQTTQRGIERSKPQTDGRTKATHAARQQPADGRQLRRH